VAYAYNPSYSTQEAGIRRNVIQGQPGRGGGGKVSETPSQTISWAWGYISVIPAKWEALLGGSLSRLAWGKNTTSYLKNK
jgi:hypothetical protein